MAKLIRPEEREHQENNHPGMAREIAISRSTVRSDELYSSVVKTPPGGSTRVHHHGTCETSVYVVSGRARFTFGPTGVEEELIANEGDFVYIPAGELHVEANVSLVDALEVVVSRNCGEPITVVPE